MTTLVKTLATFSKSRSCHILVVRPAALLIVIFSMNITRACVKCETVWKGKLITLFLAVSSSVLQVAAGTTHVREAHNIICGSSLCVKLFSFQTFTLQRRHGIRGRIVLKKFRKSYETILFYLFIKAASLFWIFKINTLKFQKMLNLSLSVTFINTNCKSALLCPFESLKSHYRGIRQKCVYHPETGLHSSRSQLAGRKPDK